MAHHSDNYTQRRTMVKKGSPIWQAIREDYLSGIPILELAGKYSLSDSVILRNTRDIRDARKAAKTKIREAKEATSKKIRTGADSGVIAGPTYHRGSRWWGGSSVGGTGSITEKE